MADKSVLEVLVEARRLIERPECWTQGGYGRRADGTSVGERDPWACAFCMGGAVERAGGGLIYGACAKAMGLEYFAAFNDAPGRTHAEVLAKFDEGIARVRAGMVTT